jgi:UDP-N-acetyl-D-mannosaminuronic acid dehydrogenase
MHDSLGKFTSTISLESTVRDAMMKMGATKENKFFAGLVVLVDESEVVIGVVTDGDIRRAISHGVAVDDLAVSVANLNPFKLTINGSDLREQYQIERQKVAFNSRKYSKVILVNANGTLNDVVDTEFLNLENQRFETIAIYGMGFVGLTLATTFANVGYAVIGFDTSNEVISSLKMRKPTFFERGLESMLNSPSVVNNLKFTNVKSEVVASVHLVSVGTPIDDNGIPDLKSVKLVTEFIASILKPKDLVIFRSTLPVGTMRTVILPILETSGLKPGFDFDFAFAPERTVEGNALEELRSLPQIVGGFDRRSSRSASELFRGISSLVVEVESLEAAELAKLMNNTYRDLIFAFANEVASMCTELNINAFKLIKSINMGYPREQIARPSPGVGGPCLTKDPVLYSSPSIQLAERPTLGLASRKVNAAGPMYVYNMLMRFCADFNLVLNDLKILIVGVAFKGEPETSDMRDSVSIELVKLLPNKSNVCVMDFVVNKPDLMNLGLTPATGSLGDAVANSDVVLFMNNHRLNSDFDVIESINRRKCVKLFFDGWDMFDQDEIEGNTHVVYATMGYMTKCD